VARDYLWVAGHRVVAANIREGRDELDLVTIDPSGAVVFVEVRAFAARSATHPTGLATLRRGKLLRFARAARRFHARHPELAGRRCRFDAIAVNLAIPVAVTHARGLLLPEHTSTSLSLGASS
jgi:Holliday junction resolvase-like predicted endonuclease